MTYYGRWTYKFEEGERRGAAGMLIVHETEPAGYPFSVVQGNLGERFDLVHPRQNLGRASIEGWLSLDAAKTLLAQAGQDFDALKKQALTREFRPVPLKLQASLGIRNSMRTIQSKNVVAKLEGSDDRLRDEYVVYTAHWDHLGIGHAVDGDDIYNGALDNASGVADLLEVARGFTIVSPGRAIDPLSDGRRRRAGAARLATLWRTANLPSSENAGRHQHRRREPMGPPKDITVIGIGASEARRLPARRRRRTGTGAAAGPGVREGLLLPVGPFQFRQAGLPGALH